MPPRNLLTDRPLEGWPHEVEVSLTGDFTRACLSVSDHTIPLGPDGRGRARVHLIPPEIELRLVLIAPGPGSYEWTVTIHGRTVRERGRLTAGKLVRERTCRFADFGLSTQPPPPAWIAPAGTRGRSTPVTRPEWRTWPSGG